MYVQRGGMNLKKTKIISLLLACIMSTAVFAGCGSKSSSSKNSMDKTQEISIPLGKDDIKTLDPSKSTDLVSGYVLQESLEALAREEVKDGKDMFVPGGAKSWKVSQDGKTWTFNLRKSKWSDGKDVTADQYVYAIQRSLAKETASDYAYLLTGAGITGAKAYNEGKGSADQVGVKAVDDLTLQITLDHPCGYFEKLLSNKLFAPQRKDLVEKSGGKFGTTANTLAYNGPFKISYFQNGSKLILTKNSSYWDAKSVKLNKITMLFLKDENSRMNALLSGQIDMVGASKQEWIDKFNKMNKFVETKSDQPDVHFNVFNTKNKYFKNAKIRKAFSLVIDKQNFFKTIAKGIGRTAYGWVPYSLQIGNSEYRDKVPEELKNDSGDAKELLKEGLSEIGADPDPSKMDVRYLLPGTDSINKDEGDLVMNALKTKLGVNIKCDFKEWGEFITAQDNGDYDFCFNDWTADYNDPMTFFDLFETGADMLHDGWSNKDYDSLIDDAKNTMDQSKRLEDFKKAEEILIKDDYVVTPLYYTGNVEFMAKYIKGAEAPLFSSGEELKYAYVVGKGK